MCKHDHQKEAETALISIAKAIPGVTHTRLFAAEPDGEPCGMTARHEYGVTHINCVSLSDILENPSKFCLNGYTRETAETKVLELLKACPSERHEIWFTVDDQPYHALAFYREDQSVFLKIGAMPRC